MQDLDWNDLRLFLAVARAGSLVGAAAVLGCNHTTLSRRLQALEAKLGMKLFQRAGRRLKINSHGRKLQRTAETIESRLIKDVTALQSSRDTRAGAVRVGVPEGLGLAYLAGRIGQIARVYPEITIELVALPQTYSLAAREADLVITLDQPKSGHLIVRKLIDYKLGFFASTAYLQENGTPQHIEDLHDHTICGYILSLLHSRELDYLRFGAIELTASICSSSIVAQRDIIAEGHAIGILPFFVVHDADRAMEWILKDHVLTRSYWITYHEDFRRTERVRIVAEEIFNITRNDQDVFRDIAMQ